MSGLLDKIDATFAERAEQSREEAETAERVKRSLPSELAWPRLDDAAFHGPAGEYVRAVEPHTEADPVAVLGQFLALAGCLLGRHVYFEVEADRHHGNLFAAFVGRTAKGRKGTSLGIARRPFDVAFEDFTRERIVSGLSSGEGLIWAVRDPVYKPERDKKTGSCDEVMVDPGVADKRLFVTEGELSSPLRVMRRDGNTLSPVIRNAWDRGDLQSLTKSSPAVAHGAHIALLGHITVDELRRELQEGDAANGFANRWLWFVVRRSKALPEGGNVHSVDLGPTVRALKAMSEFAETERRLERDAEAREVWRTVYPELSEGRPGMVGAMTARGEAQVMRLALIYAALDCSPVIEVPHLLAGLAVVTYVEKSVEHVFGDATGDRVADEILAALRRVQDGMSQGELHDYFGRHVSAARRDAALAILMERDLVEAETSATSGRPRTVWRAKS